MYHRHKLLDLIYTRLDKEWKYYESDESIVSKR
jgi:hypothetical protein